MQVTKKFYNVWGGVRMRATMLGSPLARPGPWYQRDITETLRGALEINACLRMSCPQSGRIVHAVLSKIFCCRRDVVMSRWYPGPGHGWGLPNLYWRAFLLHHNTL